MKDVALLLMTSALLVCGQALWKVAGSQFSEIERLAELPFRLVSNWFFVAGSLFYIVATGLWVYLLGRYEFSKIYPIFVGICMMLSLIVGIGLFRESAGIFYRVLGSILILAGIAFIARA